MCFIESFSVVPFFLMSLIQLLDNSNFFVEMIVYGRSLGGCVATCMMTSLTRQHGTVPQVKAMVIENSFVSVLDMALNLFPFLKFGKLSFDFYFFGLNDCITRPLVMR